MSKVTSIAIRDGSLKVKLTQDYLLGVLVPEVRDTHHTLKQLCLLVGHDLV